MPVDDCIIDGEVVVMDAQGMPSFCRVAAARAADIADRHQARRRGAARDVLRVRSARVRGSRSAPAAAGRAKGVARWTSFPSSARCVRSITSSAKAKRSSSRSTALGLEGIIAKKADAPYRGGRIDAGSRSRPSRPATSSSSDSLQPKGSRAHFGALQLADMVNGELVYAGRVGTGFNDALLASSRRCSIRSCDAIAPCAGRPLGAGRDRARYPETKTTTWVEPMLRVRGALREWTPDGLLRHAAFLRMRHDKRPHECERQGVDRAVPDARTRRDPAVAAQRRRTPIAATAKQTKRSSASRISRRSIGRRRGTRRAI